MSGDQWTTAIGVFADQVGAIRWQNDEVNRTVDRRGQEHLSVTRHVELAHQPASKYAAMQPSSIPIRWRHKDQIGQCVLLDRRQGRLSAVAVLPGPASFFTDGGVELFWSSGTVDDGQLKIRELSLTPSPATNGLPPVAFWPGLPQDAKGRSRAPWALLNRADEIIRAAHGVQYARCQFDDLDRPERPAHSSRGAREPGLEYIVRPAQVVAVNGRPPGMR